MEDFSPVAPLTQQAYVFVTGRDSGIGTVHDLVAAAAARPAELTFGSTGAGTGSHLGAALLNLMAGVPAIHVPRHRATRSSKWPPRWPAATSTTSYRRSRSPSPILEARTLVALGVSTARRSPWLPDAPTVAEQGIDGFDFPIWYGAWVCVGTPADIVRTLGNDRSDAMASAELKGWCTSHGAEPMRMTTGEFALFVADEAERAVAIIRKGPSD